MPHEITISGDKVTLAWTKESSRVMNLRLSSIGFDWDKDTKGAKMATTMAKFCWALLPFDVFQRFDNYEEVYASMDEDECSSMLKTISEIISEMVPTDEKKSTSTKSPLPESSSD